MIINPCGYPNCKSAECDTCKHNKIQEIPDNEYIANEIDNGKSHDTETKKILIDDDFWE